MVNSGSFVWSPDYILPHMGNFECDFVYLAPVKPTKAEASPDRDVLGLLKWFADKFNVFKEECGEDFQRVGFNASGLADVFAAVADILVLSSQQLILFIELINGKCVMPQTI